MKKFILHQQKKKERKTTHRIFYRERRKMSKNNRTQLGKFHATWGSFCRRLECRKCVRIKWIKWLNSKRKTTQTLGIPSILWVKWWVKCRIMNYLLLRPLYLDSFPFSKVTELLCFVPPKCDIGLGDLLRSIVL